MHKKSAHVVWVLCRGLKSSARFTTLNNNNVIRKQNITTKHEMAINSIAQHNNVKIDNRKSRHTPYEVGSETIAPVKDSFRPGQVETSRLPGGEH